MIPKIELVNPVCVKYLILLFFVLEITLAVREVSQADIEQLLTKSKIIPDILDVAPKHEAKIIYGPQAVKFGNLFLQTDVHRPPTDIDWPYESMQYYSVIMIDADAPSPSKPVNREWQHWVVGNIPEFRIKLGEVLTPYIGAIHPKGSGLHRYVFIVYKQPEKVNFTELILDERPSDVFRANFSTRDFANKYNLGDPLAVNFFVVSWGKEAT